MDAAYLRARIKDNCREWRYLKYEYEMSGFKFMGLGLE